GKLANIHHKRFQCQWLTDVPVGRKNDFDALQPTYLVRAHRYKGEVGCSGKLLSPIVWLYKVTAVCKERCRTTLTGVILNRKHNYSELRSLHSLIMALSSAPLVEKKIFYRCWWHMRMYLSQEA